MANANYLGGSFPKELSNNNFIGVVKFGNEEIAFDDDNVNILLYKENDEAILELKGFNGDKAFLNGHIFEAKKKILTVISYDNEQ